MISQGLSPLFIWPVQTGFIGPDFAHRILVKRANHLVLPASFLGALLVGVFDYWTGWEMSFSIFYLAPILVATWRGSRLIGFAISVFCAAVWWVSDHFTASAYSHTFIPYWNAVVRFGFFFLLSYLLHKLKKKLDAEEVIARTDPLTGAYNSRAFYELANAEIARARRYNRTFSLAYLDLDDFKAINDAQGHDAGDRLLTVVVDTLKSTMRESDIIARLGGDEIVVLLVETDRDQARAALQKTEECLSLTMEMNRWPVTFSIGVVTFSERLPDTVQQMITAADQLMYEAKRQGKNRILAAVYSSANRAETKTKNVGTGA